LVIVADANDVAQRLYRSLGFRVVEHYKGLEKGGY
jgi:ribosomal protein S18 acetylase RimI-like enzyme